MPSIPLIAPQCYIHLRWRFRNPPTLRHPQNYHQRHHHHLYHPQNHHHHHNSHFPHFLIIKGSSSSFSGASGAETGCLVSLRSRFSLPPSFSSTELGCRTTPDLIRFRLLWKVWNSFCLEKNSGKTQCEQLNYSDFNDVVVD